MENAALLCNHRGELKCELIPWQEHPLVARLLRSRGGLSLHTGAGEEALSLQCLDLAELCHPEQTLQALSTTMEQVSHRCAPGSTVVGVGKSQPTLDGTPAHANAVCTCYEKLHKQRRREAML